MVVAVQDFGKKSGSLEAIFPRVSKGKKKRRLGLFIGNVLWKRATKSGIFGGFESGFTGRTRADLLLEVEDNM
jgi:hypothetical protein